MREFWLFILIKFSQAKFKCGDSLPRLMQEYIEMLHLDGNLTVYLNPLRAFSYVN